MRSSADSTDESESTEDSSPSCVALSRSFISSEAAANAVSAARKFKVGRLWSASVARARHGTHHSGWACVGIYRQVTALDE